MLVENREHMHKGSQAFQRSSFSNHPHCVRETWMFSSKRKFCGVCNDNAYPCERKIPQILQRV